MIFKNGRLIFPNGVCDELDLLVEEGLITAIRAQAPAMGEQIIDLQGNYLAPGFIDLHVHGAMGRDAMEATPDAFDVICDYHVAGGTTSLLLTTATAPTKTIVGVVEAVRECLSAGGLAKAGRSSSKQVAGVHVEGPYLSKAKAGAQRASLMRKPTPKGYAPLLEHCDVIRRMTIAPELPGAIGLIDKLRESGVSVSGGHSDAWEDDAREAFEHGMRSVTHTFNCMSTTRRRGIDRVAGLLEFAMSQPEIICELIADGRHVSPTLMKMLYRAKSFTGVCLVTDATAGAGLPNGSKFSLYGTKCVIEDGVCLLADRSALAGSASRMIDLVRTMVTSVGVPLHEAIVMATDTPAFAIGLSNKGQFKIGGHADLVVISPELEVVRTFVGGAEVFRA
jgi:N-acetylglucosamine-6-phosphate deacetylase